MPELFTIITNATDAGQRLDKVLSTHLPDLSRSRLQALIGQGCVTLAGSSIEDVAYKVKSGQEFTLTVPETAPSHMLPQAIALDIIYEDEHLLVINKPAGLTVHPAPGHPDHTLVNALLAHCGSTLSGIGGVARPGIVHRIDKDTSGLLVVAKHDAAHTHLSNQLAERSLKRVYMAIVWGTPPARGTITSNIGRSSSNRQKMAVVKSGGKPAVTHYTLLESFGAVSAIECRLDTGRTHQIRVHCAYIHHPLVGDPAYGQSTASRLKSNAYTSLSAVARDALLGFTRQALHARELGLIHPVTGKEMRFHAELPADMRELMAGLR